MPPKKSEYKKTINLELDKLRNGEIKCTKTDLTKIKINTLAKKIGLSSEDVKMYMYLPTAKKYYALNDQTINLLMKGKIDMNATTGGSDVRYNRVSISDAEIVETVHKKKKYKCLSWIKIEQDQVGHSFHILILLYLIYLNMVCLNLLVKMIINIIAYILLYKQVAYQISNYKS